MKPVVLLLSALLPLSALGASVLQVNSNEEPVTVQSDWDWNDCSMLVQLVL